MTGNYHGAPAIPPAAEREILDRLFANMEISGDEIAAILKKHHVSCDEDLSLIHIRIQNQMQGLNASAGKVQSRISVLDRLIACLKGGIR